MRNRTLLQGLLCSLPFALSASAVGAQEINNDPTLAHDSQGHVVAGPSRAAAGSMMTAAGADIEFIKHAAAGGISEVKLGQLAMDKGTSPQVKDQGRQMVEDHTKSNEEFRALASRKGWKLPTDMLPDQKAAYERLSKLSGDEFDSAWTAQMTKDHDNTLALFEQESVVGKDSDLRAWAYNALPTLKKHDDMFHKDTMNEGAQR